MTNNNSGEKLNQNTKLPHISMPAKLKPSPPPNLPTKMMSFDLKEKENSKAIVETNTNSGNMTSKLTPIVISDDTERDEINVESYNDYILERNDNNDNNDNDDDDTISNIQIKTLYNVAKTSESTGDFVATEGAYQEAIKIDPLNIKTLTLFAVFLHRKKGN